MIFNLFFHYTLPQSAEGSLVWRSLHTFTSAWNKLTGSFSSFGSQPKCHLLREASVGPHNLNYILFIASPNFLLFSPTLMLFNYVFLFYLFRFVYYLFPISMRVGHISVLFIEYWGPSQWLPYNKLPINLNQFLVTV